VSAVASTKVLVVEDESAIAELIATSLQHQGFDATMARDTVAARRALQAGLPDIMVLDWMLPGESGESFLRRLRAEEATRALPVVMLTARSDEADKLAGLEGGADDYITKPFSPAELAARLRAVLRRQQGGASATQVVQLGQLQLDGDTHRVSYEGQRIHLGPTEFRLLSHLMRQPERVHSRASLLRHVWGDQSFVEDRTVDVHIKRLRAALGPAAAMVETVRGAGYRLCKPSEPTV
jgi:two-component system phosphate regulon response regulator PhoB